MAKPGEGGTVFVPVQGGSSKGSAGSVFVPTKHGKRQHGHHGALGFVENLGQDVVGAVAGLPAGLVHTVKDPVGTAEQIGKSYKQTYGPLVHGDVAKFLHNLYSHPLGPILDAVTIATLGAGAGAQAGKIAAEAGLASKTGKLANLSKRAELTYRSPKALAGGEGPVATKLSHTNPAIRARQVAIKKMLDKLPYETPHIGEAARYAKEAQRLPRQAAMRLARSKEAREYARATRNLTKEEFAAVHLVGNDIHPLDYLDALKKLQDEGEHVEPAMFKVLENPKVLEAFDRAMAGDKKLTRAIDAGQALSMLDAQVKSAHGILDEATALARAGKHRPAVAELLGKPGPVHDVYPEGTLFHGSPEGQLQRIDALHHTRPWREGPGFYLTPVREKAQSYAAGKTARGERALLTDGSLNAFRLKPGTKVLDLEKQHEDFWRSLASDIEGESVDAKRYVEWASDAAGRRGAAGASPGILGRMGLLEYLTGYMEMPASDAYYAIEEALHKRGIQATRHEENGAPVYVVKDEAAVEPVAATGKTPGEVIPGELRPTPGRPFYVPDVPVARRVANPELQKFGGGAGVPQNIVKQNRGVLFRTGQLALSPDLLGPEFLRTIKYGLADDLHATLMSAAARVSAAEARQGLIPKGWELIPKEIIAKSGGKRPQQIHPLIRSKNEALRAQEDILPAVEHLGETFNVRDLRDAAQLHGDYLIVPTSLKREMVGEFHRSTSAVRKFLDQPTKVWRSLVLGFRVGFLTNNLVGNHLLYAIHAAGPAGLRAYLNAVKRAHGEGMVKTLLSDHEIPPALRDQFMQEFFPEQAEGTFGRTQAPKPGKRMQGRKARKVRGATVGLLPATQSLAETNLRRALVETMIRKSPEFKAVYRAMPREARSFEEAAAKIIRGEGGHAYQRLISEQVNNVLGDYLNLSPFERNVLRGAFPFYSWYRAIMRISAHLALDTPARADLLTKIGQIGLEETQQTLGDVPDYLRSLLPVGAEHDGKQTVLTTGGLNPFSTVTQLGQGLAGVATGKPGDTGKAFSQLGPNPLLLAALENLAGKDFFTGRDLKGGPGGLIGAALKNVGTELPQTRLIARPGSKLYGRPTRREALLQFLGVPVHELDVQTAHSYARR